jgi:hypothetical protein
MPVFDELDNSFKYAINAAIKQSPNPFQSPTATAASTHVWYLHLHQLNSALTK